MPLFSYRCAKCEDEFEQLVRSSDTPACPACGSTDLERLVSAIAPGGKLKGALQSARRQAASEGHFSNYSKSELKGKL